MKGTDWAILAGIVGLGGFALVRYLQAKGSKDESELPADVRFWQSIVRGDVSGAGQALVDAAEPWGELLSRYVFEPAGNLPAYVDEWIRTHMVYPVTDWLEEDHSAETLYAVGIQTTAGGSTGSGISPTRLASMR